MKSSLAAGITRWSSSLWVAMGVGMAVVGGSDKGTTDDIPGSRDLKVVGNRLK